MSKSLPQSASDIAKVGEVAGQLGVSKEYLLDFSEVMIKLGDSTNLSSEAAATSLAQFANITKMDFGNVDRLGSVLVDLGNNFATTEEDIVSMGMRLAGAGSQIGLSEAEILSLSTALSSVGIEAEMGGSAFSKTMINMSVAATLGVDKVKELEKATGLTRRQLELMSSNDGKGFKDLSQGLGKTAEEVKKIIKAGKQLEQFGKVAGMTGEEFKKAFEQDAISAIGAFIDGLGNAEKKGATAIQMLEALGISEVRLRDTLLRTGSAKELFANAISTGNTAWEENIALTKEANERYKTAESQLKILKNRVVEAGIEMGGKLAPSLIEVVKSVTDLVDSFSKMPDSMQVGIVKTAIFTTGLGLITSGFGRLIEGSNETINFFSDLGGLFMGTKKLTDGTTTSISAFSKIIGGLSSPTGMIVALTTGVVAVGAKAIYDHVQDAKKAKQELEDMAKDAPKIIESYEKELDYLQDVKKEFEELNGLVGTNGDLSKLTADEQARYLDMIVKLKDISPDMGVFYNNQGQMIASANTELEKLIKTKKKEMELDKEKIASGYDNRIKDHKKENKDRDWEIGIKEDQIKNHQRIVNAPKGAYTDKQREGSKKEISKLNKEIEELDKSQDSINKTMEVAGAQLDLMNGEYDGLISNVGDYKGILEQILSDDTSNKGLETMEKTKDVMGDIFALAKKEKDGKIKLLPADMDKEIEKLTSLGVSYEDASNSIYGTMIIARDGEEAFKKLNDTMSNQENLKDTFEEIKKVGSVNTFAAEYMASLVKVENQIDQFATKSKKQLSELGAADILTKGQTEGQLEIAKKNSKEMLKTIRDETDMQIKLIEYRRDILGTISDEEAQKEIDNISKVAEDRRNSTQRELSRQTDALLQHGSRSRQVFRDMAEEFKNGKVSAEDFESMWSNLDLDTQKLLLDMSDIDAGKKGWESLMQEWIRNDPKAKELIVYQNGLEFAMDNIEDLGIEWEGLSSEEKVLTIMAFGEGLEEIEDFDKVWKGMSDDEKRFFVISKHEGIEDVEAFKKEWDQMSDEEKTLTINVLTSGVDNAKQFQEDWNQLDPEVKKFIAESVGIENVKDADEKTMSQWASDPKVKEFIASVGGLDKVRAEKTDTDGVWKITIGDKTYRADGVGIKEVKKDIVDTNKTWEGIKPKVIRFVTEKVTNFIEGVTGKEAKDPNPNPKKKKKWTGDDNFKGGLSYVGEKGRELLIYPDGSYDMTGNKTELRNLPRGTKIYNNRDTENILLGKKIPQFNEEDTRRILSGNAPQFSGGNAEAKSTLTGKEIPKFASGNAKAKGTPKPNIGNTSTKAYLKAKKEADEKVKANKKVVESEKAVADIFEKVNLQIDKQNYLIRNNSLLQETAGDNTIDKIRLLKQELELERQHIKLLNNKRQIEVKERNGLANKLSKNGFKFSGQGDNKQITNLGNISGKSKEVEEMFNRFNELQFTTIPNSKLEALTIQNKITNAISKGVEQQTKLNNQVSVNSHQLDMNAIYRERAVGDTEATIKLIKEEIKLQTKKEKLQQGQANIARAERNELEKVLKSEGFKFKGVGDFQVVTNENHVKGKLKEVQEALDKYNNIQLEVIPSIKVDREQIKNSMKKLQSEIISTTFDADDEKVAGFDKKAAISAENNKRVQRKNDPHWDIVSAQGELEATEEKRSFQYNKGWDYINQAEKLDPKKDAEDIKRLNDKAQEYFKDARDAQLEIFDLKTKVHEGQMRYIDEELNANTKSQDELKFQMELLADDDLVGKLDLTSKIAAKEIESYTTIKSNVKELEAQLKATSYNTDEWHVINDSLEKYNQLLKDSTLELKRQKDELVKIAQAQADKQFDADLTTAEKNIFGGQTEKDAKKVLDDKIEAFEDYISGEEKALEIAQIRKMVEEEGLTLTQEQQRILNEGGDVERAKLDRLNKQLNIQQLQAKLENQKNQKNIRQLVKKDDGTFDFEYVADKKAIKETEDAILESKKDLANWELKYSIDQDRKTFEEKQKLLAIEEERLQARLKAEKEAIELHYQTIMERQIAMMEMNMLLMEQLNSEKSIDGWAKTIEGIMPLMDELGINFAELMEELGIDLTDNFDIILPLLYDMGLLHEDMVDGMGIDFSRYMDAVIPVLDELGIDHREFLTFMGVDLDGFLEDANMTFAQYSEAVRNKNAETKADVNRTKEDLKVPTESTHTVKLIAPPPFKMPDSSSTHTVYTKTVGGFESGGRYKPESFDTGGYTGNFSGGKLAVLHEKEIVLNKSQSATFEKLIDIMPNMVNTFNDISGKFKGIAPKIPKVPTATNNSHSEETIQHFHINKLEFPNVKSADEIEKAILKLPMLAKQRVRPV